MISLTGPYIWPILRRGHPVLSELRRKELVLWLSSANGLLSTATNVYFNFNSCPATSCQLVLASRHRMMRAPYGTPEKPVSLQMDWTSGLPSVIAAPQFTCVGCVFTVDGRTLLSADVCSCQARSTMCKHGRHARRQCCQASPQHEDTKNLPVGEDTQNPPPEKNPRTARIPP